MTTAAFFISGHGFGHASRQVEVINALARRRPDAGILIRSAVSPELLARTLSTPYVLRPGPCDTGIQQSDSVTHDDEATVRAAVAFHRTFAEQADEEARDLARDAVALVVGDIPALAFEVADRLGVPSVAIANFTWDWVYETHPGFAGDAAWLVPALRRAYARATLALQLPLSGGFDVFPRVERLPLVARHATRSREDARAYFGLPADANVALLSFGGYGLPSLDFAAVDALGPWTIVTTDRITPRVTPLPPSVVFLEEARFVGGGFRYEDLVAAVDAVITKPGYGIIAECIANQTAMLYTSRGDFREYDVLVAELPRFLRSRFISQDDLFAGRWRAALDALVAQPPPSETMPTHGATVAAERLAGFLP